MCTNGQPNNTDGVLRPTTSNMDDWRTIIILVAAVVLVADEIYENCTGKELFKMPVRVARCLIIFTAAWMASGLLD